MAKLSAAMTMHNPRFIQNGRQIEGCFRRTKEDENLCAGSQSLILGHQWATDGRERGASCSGWAVADVLGAEGTARQRTGPTGLKMNPCASIRRSNGLCGGGDSAGAAAVARLNVRMAAIRRQILAGVTMALACDALWHSSWPEASQSGRIESAKPDAKDQRPAGREPEWAARGQRWPRPPKWGPLPSSSNAAIGWRSMPSI